MAQPDVPLLVSPAAVIHGVTESNDPRPARVTGGALHVAAETSPVDRAAYGYRKLVEDDDPADDAEGYAYVLALGADVELGPATEVSAGDELAGLVVPSGVALPGPFTCVEHGSGAGVLLCALNAPLS